MSRFISNRALAASAAGAVLWAAAHAVATAARGYEAVGGEFLFLLMPLWVWVAAKVAKDWGSGW